MNRINENPILVGVFFLSCQSCLSLIYSGFELSVQSEFIELPLASASGVRFEITGFSRIGKRILFRTALAKALWKRAFPEFG